MMKNRIITDISNYIFVADEPEKVDAIFCPVVHTRNNPNMPQNFITKAMRNGCYLLAE